MSTQIVVRCDQCGGKATDWMSKTATEAREAAANEGWVRTPRKDYCESCAGSVEVQLHIARLRDAKGARREWRENR